MRRAAFTLVWVMTISPALGQAANEEIARFNRCHSGAEEAAEGAKEVALILKAIEEHSFTPIVGDTPEIDNLAAAAESIRKSLVAPLTDYRNALQDLAYLLQRCAR